jgi:hypothetical protein
MAKHSGKRPQSEPLSPVEHAVKRITRHLANHPDGVSSAQLHAWIDTVRKGGVIVLADFEAGLELVRQRGIGGYANGVWYLRKPFREPGPVKVREELDDLPLFAAKTRS